jgi:sodium/hydrogen antiporter
MPTATFTLWMAITGVLLLAMALSSAWLKRVPISTAALYLGIGCLLGPWGFDLLRIDFADAYPWLERCTEIAVILSLSSAAYACACC